MAQLTYVASDGTLLPADDLAQVLAYDGSGNLITVTVQYASKTSPMTTFTQTLTYSGSTLTNVSQWVPAA